MSKASAIIGLAIVTLIGVLVRCYQLIDCSLWYDEAFSHLLCSDLTWDEMFSALRQDVHPPMYFILLRGWIGVWGDSIASIRGLSVTMGGATIVLAYLFTRDVFVYDETTVTASAQSKARAAGLAAALILAVSSAQIRWSQDAKMYAVATALIGLSSWLLILAMRGAENNRHRRRWLWAGWTFSTAAALYTHNYALFTFLGQCLFITYVLLRDVGRSFSVLAKSPASRAALAAVGGVLACYLPWVPTLLRQSQRVKTDYWIPEIDVWSIPHNLDSLIFPAVSYTAHHGRAVAIAVGLLFVVGVLAFQRRTANWLIILLVVTPLCCAFGVSVILASIVTPRYFLFSAMFIPSAIMVIVWRLFPAPLCFGIAVLSALNNGAYHYEFADSINASQHSGTRGAVEYLMQIHRPGQPVVVTNAGVYFSARFYANNEFEPKLLLSGQQLPHYLGGSVFSRINAVTSVELDACESQQIVVIGSTGFSIVPEAHSLPSSQWVAERGSKKTFQEIYDWQGMASVEVFRRRVVAHSPALSKRRNGGHDE